jgi:hypothetical protein
VKVFFFYWQDSSECDPDSGVDVAVFPGYWDTFEAASFEDALAAFHLEHSDVLSVWARECVDKTVLRGRTEEAVTK